jgi:hypothetical protein
MMFLQGRSLGQGTKGMINRHHQRIEGYTMGSIEGLIDVKAGVIDGLKATHRRGQR